MFSQFVGQHVTREEEINQSVYNKAAVCFARMLPSDDHYGWLGVILLLLLIGYLETLYVETAK